MRRAWIALVAVPFLAVPATAPAHGESESSPKNLSHQCKSLRVQMGADLFRHMFGTNEDRRNAHGKCVSKQRIAVRRLIGQAISECKAERAATQSHKVDGDRAERRAFRRCVREKLRASIRARRAAVRNAAHECKAERDADPAAFRLKYSDGGKLRHPFFRCVMRNLRADEAAHPS